MANYARTDEDYILYDRERKLQYIDEREQKIAAPRRMMLNLFSRTAPYEKMLNKDLCDFAANDIMNMYKSFNASSIDILTTFNSECLIYTEWCFHQHFIIDGQNHFEELPTATLKGCVNNNLLRERLISRKEVIECRRLVTNVCDYFMFIAVYEGICGPAMKDLTDLKLSDFENKGGQWYAHLSSGRTVMASDRLYVTAREANAQTFYTAEDRIHDRDLIPHNGAIIKYRPEQRVFTDTAKRGRVMKGMKHVFSEISNAKMTVTYLKDSGKIYFLRQKAKKEGFSSVGDMLSIENRSKVDFSDIENQYGAKFSISKFLNKYQSVCDTLEDEF